MADARFFYGQKSYAMTCTDMLGISDLFGSGLLPALSAGFLSSGSFRPVAAQKDGALAGGL